MKTDRQTILDLEDDVAELNCMAKLLDILLDGELSKLPTNGVVQIGGDEATALFWLGRKISHQIESLNKAYYSALGESQQ